MITKTLLAFANAITIVGCVIHELFHALMAMLLYPFGTRLTGIKIVAGPASDNVFLFEGRVYARHRFGLCAFLVAAAPMIFFLTILVALIMTVKVWSLWLWVAPSMIPSKKDMEVMKYSTGISKDNEGIDSVTLSSMLNAALDKNLMAGNALDVQVSDTTKSRIDSQPDGSIKNKQ